MFRPQKTALALAVCILTACQSTQIPLKSEINLPESYGQNRAAQGSAETARWWRNWHDPVLNRLIEQGLAQSHDIRIARSRLDEARAQARLAAADTGINSGISAETRATHSEINNPLDDGIRGRLAQNPQTEKLGRDTLSGSQNLLAAGIQASWEPDIFGRKRSDADAANYAALGQQEALYGAQLLLAGEIASNYLNARAVQARRQTTAANIAVLQKMLQYAQGRFHAGHTGAHDVKQAQSALAAAQAAQSTLDAEYGAYVRNIAVLTGQVPQHFRLPDSPADILSAQPAAPSGQTPQGLVERRPESRPAAAFHHTVSGAGRPHRTRRRPRSARLEQPAQNRHQHPAVYQRPHQGQHRCRRCPPEGRPAELRPHPADRLGRSRFRLPKPNRPDAAGRTAAAIPATGAKPCRRGAKIIPLRQPDAGRSTARQAGRTRSPRTPDTFPTG